MGKIISIALGGLVTWLAQWFTKKVAMGLATVALFVALTAAMAAAIYGLLVGITYSLNGTWACYIGMWIPSNGPAAIGAIVSARTIRWAYDLNYANIKAISYIT